MNSAIYNAKTKELNYTSKFKFKVTTEVATIDSALATLRALGAYDQALIVIDKPEVEAPLRPIKLGR